ncbi:MAG: hypothetical protein RR500_01245 [Bacilli bacterium]
MDDKNEIMDGYKIFKEAIYSGVKFFVAQTVLCGDIPLYAAGYYDIYGTKEYVFEKVDVDLDEANLCFHLSIANIIIEGIKMNRKKEIRKDTLTVCQCHSRFEYESLKGKVIAIDPFKLPKEHQRINNQIFFAIGGGGCNMNWLGQKINAINLFDGTKTQLKRTDVYGVVREEYIPSWANKKLEELNYGKKKKSKGVER